MVRLYQYSQKQKVNFFSNGVMLLLFNPVNNSIPMTIINVHTGVPMMNIAY